MTKSWLVSRFVVGLTVFALGCGGLSSKETKRAESLATAVAKTREAVAWQKSGFREFVASGGSFFRRYADKEKWAAKFDEADEKLQAADTLLRDQVGPLLKRNDLKEREALQTLLASVEHAVRFARACAGHPAARYTFLTTARKEAPEWMKKTERSAEGVSGIFDRLSSFAGKAQGDYPAKSDDIAKRLAPIAQMHKDAVTSMDAARKEYRSFQRGGDIDYAVFGDSVKVVWSRLDEVEGADKAFRHKVVELYQSYSKTLVDMRADYFVQIGRTSWDESSDFYTEHPHLYAPRQVDGETFQYFDGLQDDSIASCVWLARCASPRVSIEPAKWEILKLDPKEGWPSSWDDSAEYYVADEGTIARYYHKYVVTENGAKKETDWTEVDDEDFQDHLDDLGMDILVKPYGVYEEEVIQESAPPGMAFVGNPQYGEWKNNGSGGSFWSWYGQYRLFSDLLGDGRTYSRDEWDNWNRNYRGKSPYYGRSPEEDEYGTGSTSVSTNPRYARTTFARSGGFKSEDSSVRGAGPMRRGGGPGGFGK